MTFVAQPDHRVEETLTLLPVDGFSVTKWKLPSIARLIQMHTTSKLSIGPFSAPSTR